MDTRKANYTHHSSKKSVTRFGRTMTTNNECPVCLDAFDVVTKKNKNPPKRPVLLDCLHIICKYCAGDCISASVLGEKPQTCIICNHVLKLKAEEFVYFDLPLPVKDEKSEEIVLTKSKAIADNIARIDDERQQLVQTIRTKHEKLIEQLNEHTEKLLTTVDNISDVNRKRLDTLSKKFDSEYTKVNRLLALKKVSDKCAKKRKYKESKALSFIKKATRNLKETSNVMDLMDLTQCPKTIVDIRLCNGGFDFDALMKSHTYIEKNVRMAMNQRTFVDCAVDIRTLLQDLGTIKQVYDEDEDDEDDTEYIENNISETIFSNQCSSYILMVTKTTTSILITQISPVGVVHHVPIVLARQTRPFKIQYFDDDIIIIQLSLSTLKCKSSLTESQTFETIYDQSELSKLPIGAFQDNYYISDDDRGQGTLYTIIDENNALIMLPEDYICKVGRYGTNNNLYNRMFKRVIGINGALFVVWNGNKESYLDKNEEFSAYNPVHVDVEGCTIDMIPKDGKVKRVYISSDLTRADSVFIDKNHVLYLHDHKNRFAFQCIENAFI
jgi:hypothetical protein